MEYKRTQNTLTQAMETKLIFEVIYNNFGILIQSFFYKKSNYTWISANYTICYIKSKKYVIVCKDFQQKIIMQYQYICNWVMMLSAYNIQNKEWLIRTATIFYTHPIEMIYLI